VTSSDAVDPDRRRVVLDDAGWRYIVDEHPELAARREAILATVVAPNHRAPDPRPGRERYWGRGLGPSRWLMVVVDFVVVPARIVTDLRQPQRSARIGAMTVKIGPLTFDHAS